MSEKLRVMVFVDGTNLLVRMSEEIDLEFRADKPPQHAVELARGVVDNYTGGRVFDRIRSYWFASYSGSEEDHTKLRQLLRRHHFEPVLFKKRKGREKGVDIALTKEMLVNAFHQNFDIGYLFAGDEDYVSLVNEVKRYGPRVWGAFFRKGLSESLELAFDRFSMIPAIKTNVNLKEIYLKLVTECQD